MNCVATVYVRWSTKSICDARKPQPSVLCEGALDCFFTRSGDYLTGTNSSPDILFEIWFWKKISGWNLQATVQQLQNMNISL